jgi:hypothetical protein
MLLYFTETGAADSLGLPEYRLFNGNMTAVGLIMLSHASLPNGKKLARSQAVAASPCSRSEQARHGVTGDIRPRGRAHHFPSGFVYQTGY